MDREIPGRKPRRLGVKGLLIIIQRLKSILPSHSPNFLIDIKFSLILSLSPPYCRHTHRLSSWLSFLTRFQSHLVSFSCLSNPLTLPSSTCMRISSIPGSIYRLHLPYFFPSHQLNLFQALDGHRGLVGIILLTCA